MGHDTFKVGDLTAVIGDNDGYDGHAKGYNGVHSLVHRAEPRSIFLPPFVGMNLEHIFDGNQDLVGSREVFFEPRHAPMTFKRLSDSEAELHQEATPTFHVESWTRFALVAPHYVDFSFRFKPHQHCFRNGYIGLFWASYINGPDDKSLYFRSGGRWVQHCTPAHDNQSTVRHKDDTVVLAFAPGTKETLYKNLSPLRFDEPFYYGNFGSHVFILMFDRTEGIRFTHSPSGGGDHKANETTNPAWDFQYILPKWEVLQEYSFRARVVYRPKCSRAEIQKEYAEWKKA